MIDVLLQGDPRRAKLDAVQAALEATRTERDAIARAAVTREELAARCQREAGRLVAAGGAATRTRYLTQPGNPPALITSDDDALNIAALAIFLIGKDIVAERLLALATTDQTYEPGLPEAERAARVAELDASLHELLVEEEAECCKLESDGATYVMRRPIAKLDVGAVLEAWDRAAT